MFEAVVAFELVPFLAFVALITVALTDTFPPVVARKLVHMMAGAIALARPRNPFINSMILLASLAMICGVWLFPKTIRFAEPRDTGITTYGLVLVFVVCSGTPTNAIAPMFFADPLAAIVGQMVPSKRLFRKKTLAGTATAFLVSLVTLPWAIDAATRFILATAIAVAELFGGKLDNLAISSVLLGYHWQVPRTQVHASIF